MFIQTLCYRRKWIKESVNNDQRKGDLIYEYFQESVARTELKQTREKINMPAEDRIEVLTFRSFLS